MLDRKSMLKNFKKAVKKEAKQRRDAEFALDMKPFRGSSWSESVPVRVSSCYCELINLGWRSGDAFKKCGFCKDAERELKPHYKWSWKLNKAVRL